MAARSKTSVRARVALAAYGMLALAALLWAYFRGDTAIWAEKPLGQFPAAYALPLSLAGGGALALLTIAGTRALVHHVAWARAMHREFRGLLGPMTRGEIVVFAASSGIGEELFFRGAMQPAFGLVVSSIVFGALHLPPHRAMLPWTAWAIAMGFVFGALFAYTGHIAGPMLAHVLINYANLHFIRDFDVDAPADDGRPTGGASVTPPTTETRRTR